MADLVPVGTGQYVAKVTALRNSKRRDVEIQQELDNTDFPDIVAALRKFVADLDEAAYDAAGDPVALTNALARLETLLGDFRYVRDTVRDLNAKALADANIRRLTVVDVATVEGTSKTDRTNWEHRRLMIDMLRWCFGSKLIMADSGEMLTVEAFADKILSWFKPDWRLTPIRDAKLNPDDYCDVDVDDEGKPVRQPAVKIVDNIIRKANT